MIQSFINKIETLFENDDLLAHLEAEKNLTFEVENDHTLLEKINFENGPRLWPLFLSRLTAFFEIGFLIENQKINHLFYFGDYVERPLPPVKIKLPVSPLFNILKTNGQQFLPKLGFKKIKKVAEYSCLLIRVDQNSYIILATKQAQPWLQLRCESLQKALTKHDYFLE